MPPEEKHQPNAGQRAILEAVIARTHEMVENSCGSTRGKAAARSVTSTRRSEARAAGEPFRANVQGLPGAGKSRVIHWLRDLFEHCFGWQHGRVHRDAGRGSTCGKVEL